LVYTQDDDPILYTTTFAIDNTTVEDIYHATAQIAFFPFVQHVEYYNLTNISVFDLSWIAYYNQLLTLEINHSDVSTVKNTICEHKKEIFKFLYSITLRNNAIEHIDFNVFLKIYKLSHLDLRFNPLLTIDSVFVLPQLLYMYKLYFPKNDSVVCKFYYTYKEFVTMKVFPDPSTVLRIKPVDRLEFKIGDPLTPLVCLKNLKKIEQKHIILKNKSENFFEKHSFYIIICIIIVILISFLMFIRIFF